MKTTEIQNTGTATSHRRFHTEAAAVAAEDAGAAYQAPSLVAAGADAQHVSLLGAVLNLTVALAYFKIPAIMSKVRSRKRVVLSMALLDAFTWLPLIAAMYFCRSLSPFLLLILWVVNLFPSVLPLPIRDSWLADAVPPKALGRHLGFRAAISAAVYLAAFYTMGYALDAVGGATFTGFALISAIALGATLAKALAYSRIRDDHAPAVQTSVSVSSFIEESRSGGLGRFILYLSLLYFAVSLCGPLFAVYMLKHLNFGYLTFALVLSTELIGRVISGPFWGRHSDNGGRLRLMTRTSYLIPLVPVLWLVSSNVVYLAGVQLFSGVVWAGFEITARSLLYEAASPHKRAGYIVIEMSLVTLCRALGALAGAGILGIMIPVFGQRILGMFLLSGLLRFAVARAMLPNLRIGGPAWESKRDDSESDHDSGQGAAQGVTDAPDRRIELARIPEANTAAATLTGRRYSSRTMYHRLGGEIVIHTRPSTGTQPLSSSTLRTPMLLDNWPGSRRETGSAAVAIRSSAVRPLRSRRGLFYRPEDWPGYVEEYRRRAQRAKSLTLSGRV